MSSTASRSSRFAASTSTRSRSRCRREGSRSRPASKRSCSPASTRILTAALRARDGVAVSALRSALAAIENAGAVDPAQAPQADSGPIAGAVAGLGAGEVPRRSLGPDELRALVGAEVEHRRTAAREYAELGRPDQAERLRAEADVLAVYLRS